MLGERTACMLWPYVALLPGARLWIQWCNLCPSTPENLASSTYQQKYDSWYSIDFGRAQPGRQFSYPRNPLAAFLPRSVLYASILTAPNMTSKLLLPTCCAPCIGCTLTLH